MKIDDYLNNVDSAAISGHIKPDGDCIGSVLALYNYITRNYPSVRTDLFLEESGGKFDFLKGFDRIDHSCEKERSYDIMFCLDCSTEERLGAAQKYFSKAKKTVCLDHHVSNQGYADENYIFGDLSSACEVLYHFLEKEKMDREIAACLYTGIICDTGVFKYPSTSPETMRIAADLMEFGLDTNYIIDESFYSKNWNENRILGYAVQNSHLAFDGKVVYSVLSEEEMKVFSVTQKDLEGIVSQLRLTRGVKCAVFMYETGSSCYKVSFRSETPFDVNDLAGVFGGGGHVRAAGCNVQGDPDSILKQILDEIGKRLEG